MKFAHQQNGARYIIKPDNFTLSMLRQSYYNCHKHITLVTNTLCLLEKCIWLPQRYDQKPLLSVYYTTKFYTFNLFPFHQSNFLIFSVVNIDQATSLCTLVTCHHSIFFYFNLNINYRFAFETKVI